MKVTITLAPAAGADLQTFSLYKDDDNLPFAFDVTRAELEAGQTYVLPDGTLQVRITPDGECDDSVIEEILYIVPPEILSVSITNETQTTADATGDLVSAGTAPGGVTARGIVWAVHSFPTLTDNIILDPSTINGVYVGEITGLSEGNPYNMRAFATTAQSTFYGDNISFNSTGAVLPTVTTEAVNPFDQTTGTGHGTITAQGSETILERGVVWSLTSNPTLADFKAIGTATSPFTAPMTGLIPNTLYYVKAYATVNVGTSYGSEVTVTTLQTVGVAPTIVTGSVQSVEYDSAVVEGNVLAEGTEPVTEKGIVWATTPNPVIGLGGVTKVLGSTSTGAGSYVGNLTGMNPLTVPPTEFFARAYAISSVDTVYGADVSIEYVAVCAPFAGTADEIPVFALPPQVTGVLAVAGPTNPVTSVSWDVSPDNDVFAYILERQTGGGSWFEQTTQAGVTWDDALTEHGYDYCYRVKAQNLDGISADWSALSPGSCYAPLLQIQSSLVQISEVLACAEVGTGQIFYTANATTPQTGDTLYTDNEATTFAGDGWYKSGPNDYFEITGGAGIVNTNGNCPTPLDPVTLSVMWATGQEACASGAATIYYYDGANAGRPDIGDKIYTSTPANGNGALDGYYTTADGGVIRTVSGVVTESGGCYLLTVIGQNGGSAQLACDNDTPYFSAYTDGTNTIQPDMGDQLFEDDGGITPLPAGYWADSSGTIFRTGGTGYVIDSALPCIPS
jgi:hypothetical protein